MVRLYVTIFILLFSNDIRLHILCLVKEQETPNFMNVTADVVSLIFCKVLPTALFIRNLTAADGVELLYFKLTFYTECNRIRYTNLKICCDQMNSNITTQFLTEHFLTLQFFHKCSIWLPLVMRQTSRRYSNSSHSLSKKVTPIRAVALIRISYGCLPINQWQP
jgi:hypothetical protein